MLNVCFVLITDFIINTCLWHDISNQKITVRVVCLSNYFRFQILHFPRAHKLENLRVEMTHMGGALYGKIFSLIIVSMKDVIYYKINNDRAFIWIKTLECSNWNYNALGICNLSGSLISIYFNWHYIFPLREAINVCG